MLLWYCVVVGWCLSCCSLCCRCVLIRFGVVCAVILWHVVSCVVLLCYFAMCVVLVYCRVRVLCYGILYCKCMCSSDLCVVLL